MYRFKDKVVLVTGGGSGIGRASVLKFAKEGAELAIVDINVETAQEVVLDVKALGRKAIAIRADVSRSKDCARMIETIMEHFGKLNVQFNNAGIGGGNQPLMDLSVKDWDRLIAVNLRGVFLCCKHGMPALIKSGGGAIVNMASSMAGWDALFGGGAYMASKEAVTGITRNLALEAAAHGIRVNAVCPGIIQTELSSSQSGAGDDTVTAFFERFKKRIPLRRVGQPEDVAAAVLFLASDDARHITGTTLLIDGGQTLQSWSNAPEADAYPQYE